MVKILVLLAPAVLGSRVKRNWAPAVDTSVDVPTEDHHHHGHKWAHSQSESHNPSTHQHGNKGIKHTHNHDNQHGEPHDHLLVDTWYNTRCDATDSGNCSGSCNSSGYCVTNVCDATTCSGTCDNSGYCVNDVCAAVDCAGTCGTSHPFCEYDWQAAFPNHVNCNNHNCPGSCYNAGHHSQICVLNMCNESTCPNGDCWEGKCVTDSCDHASVSCSGKCNRGKCVTPISGHTYFDPANPGNPV